jgi:hypothetical protein
MNLDFHRSPTRETLEPQIHTDDFESVKIRVHLWLSSGGSKNGKYKINRLQGLSK